MRLVKVAITALAIGAFVALGALPASATQAAPGAAATVLPHTCPPPPKPGFCPGG